MYLVSSCLLFPSFLFFLPHPSGERELLLIFLSSFFFLSPFIFLSLSLSLTSHPPFSLHNLPLSPLPPRQLPLGEIWDWSTGISRSSSRLVFTTQSNLLLFLSASCTGSRSRACVSYCTLAWHPPCSTFVNSNGDCVFPWDLTRRSLPTSLLRFPWASTVKIPLSLASAG